VVLELDEGSFALAELKIGNRTGKRPARVHKDGIEIPFHWNKETSSIVFKEAVRLGPSEKLSIYFE
jgi:hypothetical protein